MEIVNCMDLTYINMMLPEQATVERGMLLYIMQQLAECPGLVCLLCGWRAVGQVLVKVQCSGI